jgi:hypothetical protein
MKPPRSDPVVASFDDMPIPSRMGKVSPKKDHNTPNWLIVCNTLGGAVPLEITYMDMDN